MVDHKKSMPYKNVHIMYLVYNNNFSPKITIKPQSTKSTQEYTAGWLLRIGEFYMNQQQTS